MKANIVKISEIYNKKLEIPVYQRPYTWSTKSTLALFNDIFREYKNNKNEYRIGSTILHQESDNYNIGVSRTSEAIVNTGVAPNASASLPARTLAPPRWPDNMGMTKHPYSSSTMTAGSLSLAFR